MANDIFFSSNVQGTVMRVSTSEISRWNFDLSRSLNHIHYYLLIVLYMYLLFFNETSLVIFGDWCGSSLGQSLFSSFSKMTFSKICVKVWIGSIFNNLFLQGVCTSLQWLKSAVAKYVNMWLIWIISLGNMHHFDKQRQIYI